MKIMSEEVFKEKIKNKEITSVESKGRYKYDLTLHIFKVKMNGEKIIVHVEMI